MEEPLDSIVECNGEGCCNDVHPGEVVDYRVVVGDCLPDGAGGCQRAAAAGKECCSPVDPVAVSDRCTDEIQGDGCCSHSTEEKAECCGEDDCCDEDDCCGDDACCGEDACCGDAECTGGTKQSTDEEANGTPDKVQAAPCNDACCDTLSAPDFEKDDCCSGHDSHAGGSGKNQPSCGPSKDCCRDPEPKHPSLRRRLIHVTRTGGDNQTHVHAHKLRELRRHRHHAGEECSAGSAFSRFWEAACCCLIDWSRANHHHHPKKDDAYSPVPRTSEDHGSYPPRRAAAFEPTLVERGEGRKISMLMSVQGMDCPSCASKVTRALKTVPSVSDVKVNSFSGRASFTYLEGAVLPTTIAKRAGELTGFTCSVLEEERSEGPRRVIRIALPIASANASDLPASVTIKSSTTSASQILLDFEYDSAAIKPREVLDLFSRFGGIVIPSAKRDETATAQRELMTLLYRTTISAALCIPVLVFSWAPIPPHPVAYGACSFTLTTVIQAYVAAPIYSSGLRSLLLQRILDMDLLVALSSSIAYVFSTVAYFMLVANHEFSDPLFETPALLITLITLGRLISAYARRRATSALDDLRSLQADTVDLVDPTTGVTSILSELVHVGDTLQVSPHALIPTDGVVVAGHSSVNEASITGESVPVEKAIGSPLTAGTFNGSGLLHMKVERVPSDNTVSSIGKLLAQIQDARLPVQDLADRVASYLAPVILATATGVFAIWLAVGLAVRGQASSKAGVDALQYAIAVMVVSCPCALVLCVPMVVVISAAVASRSGVLFKSAQAVQYAKDICVAVFDKTGTLTTGELKVDQTFFAREDARAIALALASGSQHPVARSVVSFVQGSPPVNLKDAKSIPGRGIEAKLAGRLVRGGSPAWLGLTDHPVIADMQSQAMTMFAVACGSELIAVFGLRDTLRPSSRAAIELLAGRGIDAYIVSGDAQPVVSALANQLGIPPDRAFGGCLPETKLERVRALQGTDPSSKRVLFVGDGTNDSLALAQADVGLSLGSGTDIALSAADVVVLDPEHTVDLARAMRAVLGISRGAVRRIALNFIWAFVYNAVAVLFAAGAFVDVRLPPQYAGLGEMVSVLPVVIVAWSMWLVRW